MRAAEYKRMMRLKTGGNPPIQTGNAGGEEPTRFCIIHDSRSHSTAECHLLRDIYPQNAGMVSEPAPQTSDLRPYQPGKLVGRSAPKIELNLIKKDGPVEVKGKSNNALFLELVIEGDEYQGMVDTGASNCFISKEVRDQLPPEAIWDILLPEEKTARFGDRTHSRIHETIRLRCSFDRVYVYYNFHVMETLAHPIIIGRDLLRDLQAEVKAAQGTVSLFKRESSISNKRRPYFAIGGTNCPSETMERN